MRFSNSHTKAPTSDISEVEDVLGHTSAKIRLQILTSYKKVPTSDICEVESERPVKDPFSTSSHHLDFCNIKKDWCGGLGLPRASDNNIVLGTRLLKRGVPNKTNDSCILKRSPVTETSRI